MDIRKASKLIWEDENKMRQSMNDVKLLKKLWLGVLIDY